MLTPLSESAVMIASSYLLLLYLATHVPRCSSQGTVNGIGERTGNANLMTIIPTLQLKMGMNGVGEHLTNLTALSRFTDEQASRGL